MLITSSDVKKIPRYSFLRSFENVGPVKVEVFYRPGAIPVARPNPSEEIPSKSVNDFLSYQTDKQTEQTRNRRTYHKQSSSSTEVPYCTNLDGDNSNIVQERTVNACDDSMLIVVDSSSVECDVVAW